MTKTELLYQIHVLLAAATDEQAATLEDDTRTILRRASQAHAEGKGKNLRINTSHLAEALDELAAALGGNDVAERIVSGQAAQDEITAAPEGFDPNDPKEGQQLVMEFDFVDAFGKDAVRSWLTAHGVKAPKKLTGSALNDRIRSFKLDYTDVAPEDPNADGSPLDSTMEDLDDWSDPEIDAAQDRARRAQERQAEEEAARKSVEGAKPKKAKESPLLITEPVQIEIRKRDKIFTGQLNPNGTVLFDAGPANGDVAGRLYTSPSKATCAALGMGSANGWLHVVFYQKGATKPTPIDALRRNPQGYETRERRTRRKGSAGDVERLTVRVERLAKSLAKATEDLEAARAALAASEEIGSGSQPKDEPDATTTRASELLGMKVKALREIAKDLGIAGRSKLKTDDLVKAILDAEAAA